MSVIQTAISKIRNKASEMFNDDKGWIRAGQFTPVKQIQSIQQNAPVKTFGPVVLPNFQNKQLVSTLANQPRYELPAVQNAPVVPKFIYNNLFKPVAESTINIPRNLSTGTARIAQEIDQSKSRPINWSNIASGVLPLAEGGFDLATMGLTSVGKNIAKQAAKDVIKQGVGKVAAKGALTGSFLGGLGGMSREIDTQYGKKAEPSKVLLAGGQGALIGGILGGSISAGSAAWEKGLNSITRKIIGLKPNIKPAEARIEAKRFLRNKKGEFIGKNPDYKNPDEIKFYGDLNESLGLGRYDRTQLGMSTRAIGAEERGRLKIKPKVPAVVQESLDNINLAKQEVGIPQKTQLQTEPLKVADQTLRSPSLEGSIPKKTYADELRSLLDTKKVFDAGEMGTKEATTFAKNWNQAIDSGAIQGQKVLKAGGVQDPVEKLMMALKESKPLRGQQEAIYRQQRAIKVARAAAMGQKIGGEKGYFAQLGQLKGEMPKVQFESLRKTMTQPDIDSLFNKVETSALPVFDKITAKTALAKLMGAEGGTVPTRGELKLLSEIFPPEFIQTVLDKRPLMQKLWSGAEQVLNLPQSMMSTLDLSAPLRQGALLIGRPKQWIPAFKEMFKYAGSEKAYKGLQEQIRNRPTYNTMREAKLAITDVGPDILGREEAFLSNLSEKIPIFGTLSKASNRAYSGFLNKLRADTFDDLLSKAKQLGVYDENPAIINDIAKFVNTATGRGDLGGLNKAAPILNAAFFSPRLMASRVQTLNPLYYVGLDPFVRKEALKSLLGFGAVAGTVLGLSKLGGAEVSANPRSADFGKIKIGDTRYDPWGGFQQYMVLASRLATGEMVSSTTGKEFKLGEGYKPTTRWDIIQRFFESKESPIASFVISLLKGQTNMGEPVNVPAEIVDRFIPMMAQDITDLYKEYGTKGVAMAVPGIFGVGSQTYTDQIPMKGKTPTGKENIQWRTQPGLGEQLINKITGTQLSNIPQEQWGPLVEERKQKALKTIEMTKAKSTVLETGESQVVGNTLIYMKDGVVKTKDIPPKETKTPTAKKLKVKKPKKITIKSPKKIKVKKLVVMKIKKPKKLKLSFKKAKKIKLKMPKLA